MSAEVLIQEAELDEGHVMIHRQFGTRVRMAYDPRRVTEATALHLLYRRLPSLADAATTRRRISV
ncbi:hypothetical protein ACFVDH_30630 [Streptomyces sp. NPDC057674]|uniref:hypothetical protein n=1 Tax=Streptomyces sp. NPDC057674 TaxID=3346203 RepID=UPI00369BD900